MTDNLKTALRIIKRQKQHLDYIRRYVGENIWHDMMKALMMYEECEEGGGDDDDAA